MSDTSRGPENACWVDAAGFVVRWVRAWGMCERWAKCRRHALFCDVGRLHGSHSCTSRHLDLPMINAPRSQESVEISTRGSRTTSKATCMGSNACAFPARIYRIYTKCPGKSHEIEENKFQFWSAGSHVAQARLHNSNGPSYWQCCLRFPSL